MFRQVAKSVCYRLCATYDIYAIGFVGSAVRGPDVTPVVARRVNLVVIKYLRSHHSERWKLNSSDRLFRIVGDINLRIDMLTKHFFQVLFHSGCFHVFVSSASDGTKLLVSLNQLLITYMDFRITENWGKVVVT